MPMQTRREFVNHTLQLGAAVALPGCATGERGAEPAGTEVNDVQSQLNATRVHEIAQPTSIDSVQAAIRDLRRNGQAISLAGGRHAMGGQQFGSDTLLLDMTGLNRIVNLDKTK